MIDLVWQADFPSDQGEARSSASGRHDRSLRGKGRLAPLLGLVCRAGSNSDPGLLP